MYEIRQSLGMRKVPLARFVVKLNSLTPLLNQWLAKNKHNPEYIQSLRDDFIEEHSAELYDDTVTLCHTHHLKLHSIYGKDPALGTAKKQMRWVEIQREKHGLV